MGWQTVRFDARTVRFDRPGMALTLNGVAQGYITDRIADQLATQGFGDVLVDIGEVAARGHRGDGAAWQAGIAAPDGQLVGRVTPGNRALATSAPMGTLMPDGLSTALCLVDDTTADRAVARFEGARIEAVA
ncbi:MAG: FAD:protein FMN transferase [Roseovarius sp.]|nr:FAD:protein FMN transferase [Roseovarius sp.]